MTYPFRLESLNLCCAGKNSKSRNLDLVDPDQRGVFGNTGHIPISSFPFVAMDRKYGPCAAGFASYSIFD